MNRCIPQRPVLRAISIVAAVVLTLLSCSPRPDSSTETSQASLPTDSPTRISVSTDAPAPTQTPKPVVTDIPTPTSTPEPTDLPSPTETLTPIPLQAPTRDEILQALVSATDVASPSFTLENRGEPTIRGAENPNSVWVNRELYAHFPSGALHKILVDLAFAGPVCPDAVASFLAGGQAAGEVAVPVPAGSSLPSDTGIIASAITGHVVLETCHGQFLIGVSTSDVEMGRPLAGQDAYIELARLVAEAQISKLRNAGY